MRFANYNRKLLTLEKYLSDIFQPTIELVRRREKVLECYLLVVEGKETR
jgi:hypothetical protein